MLRKAGYSVILAADGREAVQVFRKRAAEVACVVLDLAMPRQDGEETLREIRRASPSIPVILSSGYAEDTATQRFGGLGLAGFIQKPYVAAQLIACVRKVFPGQPADIPPTRATQPAKTKIPNG